MSNLPAFLRQLAAGAMHYSSAGLQATANAFEALEAEVKELENQLEAEKQGHRTHAARLIGERGQLRNRAEEAEAELARLKAQDPVAYTDAEQLRELRKSTFAEIYTPHESHKTDAEWIPLYAEPRPAVLQEWSDAQCLEFISIAFRHAEISGDIEMDDIRLGIKMVNAGGEIAE